MSGVFFGGAWYRLEPWAVPHVHGAAIVTVGGAGGLPHFASGVLGFEIGQTWQLAPASSSSVHMDRHS